MAAKTLSIDILAQAANEARGLAIDAINACKAGHLGLPLGCAEIGAILFGDALNINPKQPRWMNRDRFILSAGHGSMFLYAWLHMSGFDLPMEEIKKFRVLHSKTPGHPEFGETPGVECTTGPLGQGIGNAVGMALSAKMAAARFNTADHEIFNNKVIALAGDGCLQEGVALEAISFAAHNKLDNLILIYDSNDVTLDAMADKTQSEDVAAKFEAIGWTVQTINGHDLVAVSSAYEKAYTAKSGMPQLIIAKTEIGRGIPEIAGKSAAHGEGGAKYADSARKALGLPEETFYVSEAVRDYFSDVLKKREEAYAKWQKTYNAWKTDNPENAQILENAIARKIPSADELLATIPVQNIGKTEATRTSAGIVLNYLAKSLPTLISGAADLHSSTKNYIKDAGDFSPKNYAGRNIYYGIREHAMGAIMNGIAYDGLFMPSGSTFFTFVDYMRPAVRLASLAKLPVTYILTHDSVQVGVDGPTHQPVETLSSLRCIPNMRVIRPADNEETAAAFVAAVERSNGPTALVLTRQDVPSLSQIPAETRRSGVFHGAYIAQQEKGDLRAIILAAGSEVLLALKAAEQLGDGIRVVSVPSMEIFNEQPENYRETILPSDCRKRVAVEAGATQSWYRYVGLDGKVLGIDRFGVSAPGDQVMKEVGLTQEALVAMVQSILQDN